MRGWLKANTPVRISRGHSMRPSQLKGIWRAFAYIVDPLYIGSHRLLSVCQMPGGVL